MSGQGKVTRALASRLEQQGWHVVYTCIPNTPHVKVTPIPVLNGEQRYPDIVAYRGDVTRFIEVEIALSNAVADNIARRFDDYVSALREAEAWSTWKSHVLATTGHVLPDEFHPRLELAVCRRIGNGMEDVIERLESAGISVSHSSS